MMEESDISAICKVITAEAEAAAEAAKAKATEG
jgi:hypothetical protein